LPKLLCRQVSQELVERLRVLLNAEQAEEQANIFVLDGSSLELEHSPQLLRRYAPAPNQYGRSHWPVLPLVVMHDAETGLAQQPCWGAMYGPEAVSQQELAEKAMDSLPERSVILGDRNFGIFSIAYAAQQKFSVNTPVPSVSPW
jgi:putative transposase